MRGIFFHWKKRCFLTEGFSPEKKEKVFVPG